MSNGFGLIGATGFVGSTLTRQHHFDKQYNSKNIGEIAGQHFSVLVCAGAPAEKWKANKEPVADRENLQKLMDNLKTCTCDRFVLISTVDVYAERGGVDESSTINRTGLHAYGLHRLELEDFANQTFKQVNVVRLPALFGLGLKKNFLYDLLNDNCLDWTDHRSCFQFYDMSRLWSDLEKISQNNIPLVNLATAPVQSGEVARRCFDREFKNETAAGPVFYDMHSRYAEQLGGRDGYLYDAEESFRRIRDFVKLAQSQPKN